MLVRLLLQFAGHSIIPRDVQSPAVFGAVALDLGSFLRTKSKEPRRPVDICSRGRLFELRTCRVWSSNRQCKFHSYCQFQSRLGLQTIRKRQAPGSSGSRRYTRIKGTDFRGLGLWGLFQDWLVASKRLDPGSSKPARDDTVYSLMVLISGEPFQHFTFPPSKILSSAFYHAMVFRVQSKRIAINPGKGVTTNFFLD